MGEDKKSQTIFILYFEFLAKTTYFVPYLCIILEHFNNDYKSQEVGGENE